MKRTWLVILSTAASLSCGETTTTQVTQLNLDRPIDVAFACFGSMRLTNGNKQPTGSEQIIETAQPTLACEMRSPQATPETGTAVPPGQADVDAPAWYGFILQSKAGTLALAKWSAAPAQELGALVLLDADPLTPGYNSIAIGEEPIAIATDKAGCYELTANAGSCDLSTLEVTSAVDEDPSTAVVVRRVDVTAGGKRLRARPAAMAVEPPLFDAPGATTTVIGNACPQTPTGLVYVAYPGCDLVAGINAADGTIQTGIKLAEDVAGKLTATVLDSAGVSALSCMDECLGEDIATPAKVRPVALDLRAYTGADTVTRQARLVIGSESSASLAVVDLDPATSLPVGAPLVIGLQESVPGKALGVSAVSLSPVISMGGDDATNNDSDTDLARKGQYVYAVASDGTVRVADVLTKNAECDTQVDGRLLRTQPVEALQCFPVGAPTTPRRRPGAKGPGIELPGEGVPTSVVIVKGLDGKLKVKDQSNKLVEQAPTQNTGIGHFAVIASSTGSSYVVNVDDDARADKFSSANPFSTAPALVMAHQLRDAFEKRDAKPASTETGDNAQSACKVADASVADGGSLAGGPRASTAPAVRVPTVSGSTIATNKQTALPQLRQLRCVGSDALEGTPVSEVQFGAAERERAVVFPDLGTIRSETWTLVWEGLLSQDSLTNIVDGPQIRHGQMRVDEFGMSMLDQSRPYCEMGVELFDIVQLRGCNPANGAADCPSGFECFLHPERRFDSAGVCMATGQGSRLASPCKDFMVSRQRYTVARPDAGKLVLWPRKHVLSTTPIGGCTPDPGDVPNTSSKQCKAAADLALQMFSAKQPFELAPEGSGVHDTRIWACEADELRAPVSTAPESFNRCVQKCAFHTTDQANPNYDAKDRDADCDVGTVCVNATPGAKASDGKPLADGTCMESVQPPPACVKGLQRYDVRASEAFVAIGTRSGYVHPIIADQNGRCVRNPNASPLDIGRIPLQAPQCNANADPVSGEIPGVGPDANPCATAVDQFELRPNYANLSTCALGDPETKLETRAAAPAIRFRNSAMNLTLVDPYVPGDQTCVGDRLGNLGKIPLVVPGYQLTFDQRAGLTPVSLGVSPVFPVKVVRGPSDSIWVMDAGDFLSTQLGVASTSGGVYRVEPQAFDEAKSLR